jgi:acetyltransferase-like isoleucine patch superfamily enzyme
MIGKLISRSFLAASRLLIRAKAKAYSVMVSGGFAHFGRRSVLMPPIRIEGEGRIAVGNGVYVEARSWIQTLPDCSEAIGLRIGDGTSIGSASVISAACSIVIEENVVMAPNVCIVDHNHRYSDPERPIKHQGIDKIAPVKIGRNTWIGQNTVILPGVTIGRNCVIGANSVVNRSIPDYSLAAGAPARVIRVIAESR